MEKYGFSIKRMKKQMFWLFEKELFVSLPDRA